MKKIFFLLLFFPLISFGQYEKEIDSITKVINTTKNQQIKVDSYRELVQVLLITDLPKAQKTIKRLYKLNENNSCEKCEAMSDYLQAKYYTALQTNSEKIFFYYKKSIDKSYKIKDYNFYSIATIHLINRYITKNKINEAEIELKSYLDLTKKINYENHYDGIYYLYGKLYKKRGFNNLALENYLLSDKYYIKNKVDDIPARIGDLLEIAMFYTDLNQKDKATQYINLSLELLKKTNDPICVVNSNFRLGEIEYKNKKYKKSLSHFNKILSPKDTSITVP
ncbi:MAG TPA: hypothetical protein PKH91_08815, partial [Flavobacterium sp.]|nr:hypothetical protein [Flavobacterium sp.]